MPLFLYFYFYFLSSTQFGEGKKPVHGTVGFQDVGSQQSSLVATNLVIFPSSSHRKIQRGVS